MKPFVWWLFLLSICGHTRAQGSLKRCEYSHRQMGTLIRLVFYAADTAQARSHARAAFHLIDSFNTIFSDYQSDSELNRLCARPFEKVAVSAPLWEILNLANRISTCSEGAFDVTVGPLSRLWRRARHLQEMPDSAHIATVRQSVGYRNIHFYKKEKKIRLGKAQMQIDLGGIAQGYTADACLYYLKKAGGDIALGAPPPGAEGWKIDVPVMTDSNTVQMQTVLRSHGGITSSGALYKYLEINGIRYSHIIDPRTGYGLTHCNWVTVTAPDAVTADVWATALSVGGFDTRVLKRKFRRVQFWVTRHTL
jgi:FAD:protein FMN transferase